MGIFGHMTANAPMKADEGGDPSDPDDTMGGIELDASITEMSPARSSVQKTEQQEEHYTINTSPTSSN